MATIAAACPCWCRLQVPGCDQKKNTENERASPALGRQDPGDREGEVELFFRRQTPCMPDKPAMGSYINIEQEEAGARNGSPKLVYESQPQEQTDRHEVEE